MATSPPPLPTTSSEEEIICPICLLPPSNERRFCVAQPCGHILCLEDAERILLARAAGHNNNNEQSLVDNVHRIIPTLGTCPICRQELSLFDLTVFLQDNRHDNQSLHDDEAPPTTLCVEKNFKLETWPIFNKRFRDSERTRAFCFDQDSPRMEYYNTTSAGGGVLTTHTFRPETCHFHSKSMTFHGQFMASSSYTHDEDCISEEVIIQFSSDLRYITTGVIIKTRGDGFLKRFVMDGKWMVKYEDGSGNEQGIIPVHRHECSSVRGNNGISMCLNAETNPVRLTFNMTPPLDEERRSLMATVDIDLACGPKTGDELTFAHPNGTLMFTFKRLSVPRAKEFSLLGTGLDSFSSVGEPRERPHYRRDSIWNNTFCQAMKVGLASYHFIHSDQKSAYISYEHFTTSHWPPLDDGSPIPSRVYFKDFSYNDDERTFTGRICWFEDFGTTWQGVKEWRYEMKFDSNFLFICSGQVHSIISDDNDNEELFLMSTFGSELIYVNAAIDECFHPRIEQPSETTAASDESIQDRFIRLSQPMREEWASEGASVRTIAVLHSALTQLVTQVGEGPIDFNTS